MDEQRSTEQAKAWFAKKVQPTEIKKFELVDTNLWEFTAMIVPLWENDGFNTPVEYSGAVFLTAPSHGAEFALEYHD